MPLDQERSRNPAHNPLPDLHWRLVDEMIDREEHSSYPVDWLTLDALKHLRDRCMHLEEVLKEPIEDHGTDDEFPRKRA